MSKRKQDVVEEIPITEPFECGGFVASNTLHVRAKHGHYFKNVQHLREVDVYRTLKLFDVTDPAIAHAIKKLLVAGGRGAGKNIHMDVQEAIDTLTRWKEMQREDELLTL